MTKILHIENTSICNAACPMCARNVNGEGIASTVTLGSLPFEKFQQHVLPHLLTLDKIFFCGSVGDPCGDKNLLKAITWVKSLRPDMVIGLNTNGSIQNVEWWRKLAQQLTGVYDYVVFSIDGLEDTNHIYRVRVPWHKIMTNAQSFIDAGGSAHWDMLVFEHNKHQVEECKALADSMGFTWFRVKETDRWDQFDLKSIKPASEANYIDYNSVDVIQCERNIEDSTYIDYKGQEFPCCHIGEMYYSTTQRDNNEDILSHTPEELMTEYQTRLDNNNPFYTCKRACGKTAGKHSQWKQEIQLK